MAYQSYVAQFAKAGQDRAHDRIELQDSLKNSASARTLQDRQGRATLTNAASNARNATTNAMNASTNRMGTMADIANSERELALKEQTASEEITLAREAQALNERKQAAIEAKIPAEIDALRVATERDKLAGAQAILDFQLNSAMQAGKLDRIGSYFALQDALTDNQMGQIKTEEGLRTWGMIGRHSSGIVDALKAGDISTARTLHGVLMQELEDANIDMERYPMLGVEPNQQSVKDWGIINDMAITSVDFRQQMLLQSLKNRSSAGDSMLSYLRLLIAEADSRRAQEDQNISNFKAYERQVGAAFGTAFDYPTNDAGQSLPGHPAKAKALQALTNNFITPFRNEDGSLNAPPALLDSIKIAFESRLKPVKTGWIGANAYYTVQPDGILPFEGYDASDEMSWAEGAKFSNGKPANESAERLSAGLTQMFNQAQDPNVRDMIKDTLKEIIDARTPETRGRVLEQLVHGLTLIQVGLDGS